MRIVSRLLRLQADRSLKLSGNIQDWTTAVLAVILFGGTVGLILLQTVQHVPVAVPDVLANLDFAAAGAYFVNVSARNGARQAGTAAGQAAAHAAVQAATAAATAAPKA